MKHAVSPASAALAALVILSAAASARGSTITGTITGEVTSAGGSVPGISAGSLVTGSFTYDTSKTQLAYIGPVDPFESFSLTIGDNPHVFSLADLQGVGSIIPGLNLNNSSRAIGDLDFSFDPAVIGNAVGATVHQQGISYTPSFGLPAQAYSVTTDPAHSFAFDFTATPGVVPEPSSLILWGIAGVAGLGVARVRRKRLA